MSGGGKQHMRRDRRWPDRRREGSVAVTVAVSLVVLLGVAALAVDIGHGHKVRAELQLVADSAALAAAAMLDGTVQGMENAEQAAIEMAGRHRAYDGPVELQPADIEFGRIEWVFTDGARRAEFIPMPGGDPAVLTAVRVQPTRVGAGAVRNSFAGVLGQPLTDVDAAAVAIGGGPETECVGPMWISECHAQAQPGHMCGGVLRTHGGQGDGDGFQQNMAFAGVPNPSVNAIDNALNDFCSDVLNGDADACGGNCDVTQVDGANDMQSSMGNTIQNENNGPCPRIAQALERYGAGNPTFFTMTAPLLEHSDCGEGFNYAQANGTNVVGYARVDIYGIECGGNGPNSVQAIDQAYLAEVEQEFPDVPADCTDVPSGACLLARVHCDTEQSDRLPGGGGFTGMGTRRVSLVQ